LAWGFKKENQMIFPWRLLRLRAEAGDEPSVEPVRATG
jgi:hypothetical protein